MELVELLATINDAARAEKEFSVRRGARNVPMTVTCFRDDHPVAVVQISGGRDALLPVARLAASGYSADLISLSVETWQAVAPNNPLTGRQWEPGEMDDAAEKHDAVAKGWVWDAVSVIAVNRAGDMVSSTNPYRMMSRRRIEWIPFEKPTADPDDKPQGGLAAALREIMSEPSLMQMAADDDIARRVGLSHERAQAISDIATSKLLINPPPPWRSGGLPTDSLVALFAERGTVRHQMLVSSGLGIDVRASLN